MKRDNERKVWEFGGRGQHVWVYVKTGNPFWGDPTKYSPWSSGCGIGGQHFTKDEAIDMAKVFARQKLKDKIATAERLIVECRELLGSHELVVEAPQMTPNLRNLREAMKGIGLPPPLVLGELPSAIWRDYLATSREWHAYLRQDGFVWVEHGDTQDPYIRRSRPGTRDEAWGFAWGWDWEALVRELRSAPTNIATIRHNTPNAADVHRLTTDLEEGDVCGHFADGVEWALRSLE